MIVDEVRLPFSGDLLGGTEKNNGFGSLTLKPFLIGDEDEISPARVMCTCEAYYWPRGIGLTGAGSTTQATTAREPANALNSRITDGLRC